jgi:hypothetical protein
MVNLDENGRGWRGEKGPTMGSIIPQFCWCAVLLPAAADEGRWEMLKSTVITSYYRTCKYGAAVC